MARLPVPSLSAVGGGTWSARKVALTAAVCVVAALIARDRGHGEGVGGDFHVFWQAGHNFAAGAPLYHGDLPGARRFIYPPFAAMAFQVLAIFPLPLAAEIFSFLNLALFGVTVWLTQSIVARTNPDRVVGALPLVFAVVLSLVFSLDNFGRVQINEVIFLLILLGIDAYLRARDVRAAAYFVTATAIKITSVFFAIWLVLRGRGRAAWAVPTLAVACVVLPLLWRGPATGAADLAEYYHSFLAGFQHGQVMTDSRIQNLGAMIYRMMRPAETPEQLAYAYLPTSERVAALTYKVATALLLLLFLANLGLLRARGATLSAFELSGVFLISHLLSPITERAHLVTLLFVFHTFLAVRLTALPPALRGALVGLWLFMAVSAADGRDVVGRVAYYEIAGYSVVVWTMVLLLLVSMVLTQRVAAAPRPAEVTGS